MWRELKMKLLILENSTLKTQNLPFSTLLSSLDKKVSKTKTIFLRHILSVMTNLTK